MNSADNLNSPLSRQALRQLAKKARRETPNRTERSCAIWQRLLSLPAYQKSNRILYYIQTRDEVDTLAGIAEAMNRPAKSRPAITQDAPYDSSTSSRPKVVHVPYCVGPDLHIFRLESMADLVPGAFGILEPTEELRNNANRNGSISDIDAVIVPGVAFDQQGGRLGYGKGFYDRLLQNARPTTPLIGLAFDSQIVPSIPMEPHDIPMDFVVTESQIYQRVDGKVDR